MISFHTNDSYKKHHTLLSLCEQTFFVVFNQINKHKPTIYNHCMYTKISCLKYKNVFVLLSIKMINLSSKELKLIAQI